MSCRGNPTNPTTPPAATSPAAATPPPCPTPCTITSQTVATSPANRARTKIGVGEEVDLTVSPAPATWAITSGGGTLTPSAGSQPTVRFKADDNAASVTITATGSGCSCSITFSVVRPSNWKMKRVAGENVKHTSGNTEVYWHGNTFYQPADVNFYNIETREKDSQCVGTGSKISNNGLYHGNYPPPDRASDWLSEVGHTDADGTLEASFDNVSLADPGVAARGAAPPFTPGLSHFDIVIQWRVVGLATVHDLPSQPQEGEIFADGHCESRKGGNTERIFYSDATTNY